MNNIFLPYQIKKTNDTNEALASQLAQIVYQVPVSNGTDDTSVLQTALDYSSQHGITARLAPNQTYIITAQGTMNVIGILSTATVYQYCLKIGVNTTLDLNGSKIQVKANQDASAIINKNPNLGQTAIDNNITIMNGTIDSQCSLQGSSYYQSAIYISNVNNLTIKNMNIINSQIYAMTHYGLNNVYMENININTVNGAAFNFGNYASTAAHDGRNNNAVIKDLTIQNCVSGYFYPSNVTTIQEQGNSVYVCGSNISFYNVRDINTQGGKYAECFSNDIYYDSIYLSGANSVCKIQNDDGNIANSAHNVYIKNIHSVGVGGYPFEIDISKGIYVDHLTIDNPTGTSRAVYLDGDDIVIKELFINNAPSTMAPIYTKVGCNIRLDHVEINGCGGYLDIEGNRHIIGEMVINRTDITQTGTVIGISKNVIWNCNYLEINTAGSVTNNYYVNVDTGSDVVIKRLRVNYNASYITNGQTITLASGTTTSLTNVNIYNSRYGRYVTPVVKLIPLSSTARGITIQGYRVGLNTLTILHSTAVGTEQFIFVIDGYVATDAIPS